MLPRHDVFFYAYYAIYMGGYDKLIMEFEMSKEAVDEFVLAINHKRTHDAVVNSKNLENKPKRTDLVCCPVDLARLTQYLTFVF
jgi:hypothetical protein